MHQPSRPIQSVALLGAVAALLYVGVSAPKIGAATYTGSANLLTGDTATLRHSVGSWVGRNATVSRPTRGVLNVRARGNSQYMGASTVARGATRATPLKVYSGAFTIRARSASRSVASALYFYDKSHKQVAAVTGQQVTDRTSGWITAPPAIGIAPTNASYVVLGIVVAAASQGETHQLSRPSLVVSTQRHRDVVGPLYTKGNRIYDARGPIELKGIHRRGLELETGLPMPASEMVQAKRWGATMIRLSLSSSYWNKGDCHFKPDYASRVDAAVKAVTSQHMVALLDLHTNEIMPCGLVKQQMMADRAGALPFWWEVASRYKSNPLVAFDLYNEPHWIDDDIWLHGGLVTKQTPIPFRAAGMQEMYDVVRSTGAKNLVIVTGQVWGNELPDVRVKGYNIVYGLHVYTCPRTPDTCSHDGSDPSHILRRWIAPSARVPVAVTEFGWPSPADGNYLRTVISYATHYHWSWVAFGWDGTTQGDFSLVHTMGSVYEPTPSGIPAVAGMNFH